LWLKDHLKKELIERGCQNQVRLSLLSHDSRLKSPSWFLAKSIGAKELPLFDTEDGGCHLCAQSIGYQDSRVYTVLAFIFALAFLRIAALQSAMAIPAEIQSNGMIGARKRATAAGIPDTKMKYENSPANKTRGSRGIRRSPMNPSK